MESHLGYEPDEKDLRDVRLLHEALGIGLRGKYRELLKDSSHS
ncbi:MAG: hypothetical protein WAU33_11265 [Candidatus Binataceae bacterium]